ncbi:MAG: DHHA2 domain-containing protein, partial [Opitutales bacterium]
GLVRRDCKSFIFEGIRFLAAQVETVDLGTLTDDREFELRQAFSIAVKSDGASFGALMITDVLAGRSRIMIISDDDKWRKIHMPKELQKTNLPWIETSFVSRKKQLIPLLLNNIKSFLTG